MGGFGALRREISSAALLVASGLVLGACATDFGFPPMVNNTDATPAKSAQSKLGTKPRRIQSEPNALATKAIETLDRGDTETASRLVNAALQLQVTDSNLQLLNGVIYHRMGEKGDLSKLTLAEQGYALAIQFDPTNWRAYYQLGLLNLDRRNFAKAQRFFAEAAFFQPNDPDILYNMAMASYYNRDPETAAGALKRLRAQPEYDKNAGVLHASSMVMAALGETTEANGFLALYKENEGDPKRAMFISQRVKDWDRFHEHAEKIMPRQRQNVVPAQLLVDQPENRRKSSAPGVAPAGAPDANQMVIVDVVIIRTEENNTTSKGVNLLNGLKLQFGNVSKDTSNALEFSESISGTIGNTTHAVVRRLTVPSVEYSLNIFNANSTRNEVLARPTLVGLNGEPSEFFSGVEINAAAVSGGDGEAVNIDKEIGVKLTVTPQVLDNGQIKLSVQAQRTFLTTPNTTSVNFTFRIDTSKTNVNANVVMDFDETLILSGMSEKETERTRDGVPGLQDVPLVQYLFSKAGTTDFQKSVLILVTPRPPEFIQRSARNLARDQQRRSAGQSPVLNELRARYADWFKPYPNWASVFHHMQDNSLYREFRTGDVSLEEWNSQVKRGERIKQFFDFLYF